jgi:Na+-translocating ferredoxin:NAD+ oxidoreductase RnfE subunit
MKDKAMIDLVPMFDALKYLILGMFIGLIAANILILGALATHHKSLARKVQRILDRFAWPLRMAGF